MGATATKVGKQMEAVANECIAHADPTVKRDFLDAQYFESLAGSPAALAERIRSEEPKWRKLIRDSRISAE